MDKDKLLKLLKENKKNYESILKEKITDYLYRSERYGNHFSLSIGVCDFGIDLTGYCEFIRQTDKFIVLEENLCCVVLDSCDSKSGIKAANNMLAGFQSRHFSKLLYSAVVSSDEYPKKEKLLDELFYVLEYAINHNMDNIVLDPDAMLK